MTSGVRRRRFAWGRPAGTRWLALVLAALVGLEVQAAAMPAPTDRPVPASPSIGGDIVIRVRRITASRPDAFDLEHMSREVERIWAPHGVRFDWRDGQGIVVPAERAHLVVTLRRTAERTHEVPPGALAALHRMRRFYGQAPLPGRPDAVIVVALDRVERLAADAVARERSAPARAVAARLSVLLGRVVAHEIGHYLLESGEHTGYGLMRAAYGAGDTTCAPDYGLDSAQTARVRSLWWQRASAEVIIAAR